jgi:hypothetical protein
MGERTSSSRCTFVNCTAGKFISGCFVTIIDIQETHVVVAEEVNVAWVFFGGNGRVWEVDQSVLSSEFLGRTWVPGESCPGGAEFGYVRAVVNFILGKPDDEVRTDSDTSICAAVTGIIPPLSPGLSTEVENVDVVKPDVREVLSADNE